MSIDGYADDGYAGSSHEAMDNYYRRMDNFARDRRPRFEATIGPESLFSWESQVCQYPYVGEPGIEYFPGETQEGIVDCLLYRNDKGHIVGILNHFPWDGKWERRGNVNIWIHRKWQRKGIGRALWAEAVRRFGCKLEGQRFTPAGAAFASALAREAEANG